ncbi:sensor histidine kinase [Leeuwenhoekiella polynyae]|uniref:histidine kinase n=1 Tax=Leeuwenhoekiella polynyae TaxID=1550906 RepID=A0A4Q0PH80_9FLAO|nr:HAMP domain-containing sensor histidine kinase [Leeuwenhoekiella polynyae]RXG25589.1 two-component system phosphate regulon sensor histidine kinase PhoR [Leeuwenhoekiella polynyae]
MIEYIIDDLIISPAPESITFEGRTGVQPYRMPVLNLNNLSMLKRRKLYILVFIIAIVGLFVVQVQFLRIGLNLAKVQFDKKVSEAGILIKRDLANRNQLTFLIEQALLQDTHFFTTSPDSITDASRHFLDDFIKHRLTETGIEAAYSYRLYTRDSTYYMSAPRSLDSSTQVVKYPFELTGFLEKSLGKAVLLELEFPDLNTYFFFQLNGLTIPGLVFTIVIILVVIWVLRSFYWQRNIITTTNDFINNLTHELKTPVFSIGLASKILDQQVSAEHKILVNTIRQQTERLKIHIEKVLELGNLEANKKVIQLKPTDFKPHLEAVCQSFKAIANLENIPFTYKISGETYPVLAATTHLENALNNILDNARKYGNLQEIKLQAERTPSILSIRVSDQGPGIEPKEKNKIFKKYYRGTQRTAQVSSGYGLGLSYSLEVLKKHRGKLKLDSIPGAGTTVTLIIPLTDA